MLHRAQPQHTSQWEQRQPWSLIKRAYKRQMHCKMCTVRAQHGTARTQKRDDTEEGRGYTSRSLFFCGAQVCAHDAGVQGLRLLLSSLKCGAASCMQARGERVPHGALMSGDASINESRTYCSTGVQYARAQPCNGTFAVACNRCCFNTHPERACTPSGEGREYATAVQVCLYEGASLSHVYSVQPRCVCVILHV